MQVKGINSTIMFDGQKISLIGNKVFGVWICALKGEKSIPLSSLGAVQLCPATLFNNGFLQLTIRGGVEKKSGVKQAMKDENAVVFYARDNEKMKAINDSIVQAMLDQR